MDGDVNVIVSDGFTGNVALKTAEGTANFITSELKKALTKNIIGKLSSLLNIKNLREFRNKLDPRLYNGAILLGLESPVIKSHGGTDYIGFANSLKLDCTTADASVAAGSYMSIDHRIEAQNLQHLKWGTSSAKNLTISFWVRSNLTGTYVFEYLHGDAFVYNSNTYTIDAANTWEKKTITISGYTPTAINDDNGIGLYTFWWLQAGSTYGGGTTTNDTWHTTQANRAGSLSVDFGTSTDNEFYLTGVQLEVGDVATPFEHRSIGDELLRCQRYFTKWTNGSVYYGARYSSGNGFVHLDCPVRMRAYPTVTIASQATTSGLDIVSYNSQERVSAYMASISPYVGVTTADAEL